MKPPTEICGREPEESGVERYHQGQFAGYDSEPESNTPNKSRISSDADGHPLFSFGDFQVYRFADGKFTHYNAQVGLYNDGAFQILEDARQNFWISSNRGIYRVSNNELNEFADGKRNPITSVRAFYLTISNSVVIVRAAMTFLLFSLARASFEQ